VFWRAISCVADAIGYDKVLGLGHAREAGRALGLFHRLLSDLRPETLHDTLPGFHNTPGYLQHYDAIGAGHNLQQSATVRFCAEYIESKRHRASVLEDAVSSGKLQLRIMHGDPKLSNILIDNNTDKAVAIIDLDTVKPGLIHYDIGDCLRSCCNPLGEETVDHDRVAFDIELGRSILSGYFAEAGPFLTNHDIEYIYDSAYLFAFELGLRFLTDYLAGNVYFKADHREHNLSRALVQFGLAASIEKQEGAIRGMIDELVMTNPSTIIGKKVLNNE
jgi:Ser/Thr protein kinase RdoA (MazF antagonist)